LGKYGSLLSTPGARGFVVAGFLARMPMSMRGLGCVLMLVALTGSYGLAGAVAATLGLSQALTDPWLGRLADRHGQRRLLFLALAARLSGTLLLVFAAQVGAPAWTLFPAAGLSGAAVVPVGSLVRARWAGLVGGTPALDTAFALESVLDEAVFVVGPVLVTALAVGVAPAAGLLVPLVFVVVGSLLLALQEDTEPEISPETRRAGRLAVLSPGLLVLILTCAAVGIALSVIDVGMVAFAREQGSAGAAGPLLALFAAGSMLAGLAYGAREWRTTPDLRFLIATAACCAGVVPILLADGIAAMALSVTIAGVGIAPALISGSTLVEELVPRASLVEGLTWVVTALTIGASSGAVLAGVAIDLAGSRAAFALALGAGLVSVLVAVVGRALLRPKRP
jgi:MFS family permease